MNYAAPWVRVLLLAALAGALLLALCNPPAWTLDVGAADDTRYTAGLFRAEDNAGTSFRWTGPETQLRLHGAGSAPTVLELRLHGTERPTPTTLHLASNAQTQAAFAVHSAPGWRRYRVLLPAEALAGPWHEARPLHLTSTVYTPGTHDMRALGVPLDQVRVLPLRALPADLLPLLARVSGLVWLVALLGWGLVRLGVSQRWVLLLAGAVGLGLVGLAWRLPFWLGWAMPATPWLLALLTLLLAATSPRLVAAPGAGQRTAWGAGLLALAGLLLYTHWALVPGALLAGAALVLLATGRPLVQAANRGGGWWLAGLGGVLLVALALRLWQLDSLPYGMWRDEARHGLVALHMLEDPAYRPVYEPGGGVHLPGLGLRPFAWGLAWGGIGVDTLRLLPALAGALTVLPLYALARLLGLRAGAALLAAALLAVASWHLTISRFAFPTAFDPLLSVSGLALLLAALHARAHWLLWAGAALLAGACLGWAAQTYHTGRVVPVLGLALLALWGWQHRHAPDQRRRALLVGTLGAVGLALAVWPLVSYALRYPTAFNDRVGDVFLLGAEALQGRAPLAQLDEALGRHALMFHAVGDQNGRHHAPGFALLGPVTGAGLLAGLALLLRHWRAWQSRWLLLALAACVAPSLLAVGGPHAMRSIGAAALACLIAALGWWHLARQLGTRRLLAGVAGLALAANVWVYFWWMPVAPPVWTAFYPIHTQVGKYVRTVAEAEGRAALRQVYVPAGLRTNEVLIYLGYHLPVQQFADDGRLTRAPAPGARLVLSGYTYREALPTLAPYLGDAPQPVLVGPLLPGRHTPAYVVYAVP